MIFLSTPGGATHAAFRAAMTGAALAFVAGVVPANAVTCVKFVKDQIQVPYPSAYKAFAGSITAPDMYAAAKKLNSSSVGWVPSKGAIMIFAADTSKKGMEVGHAALVAAVKSSSEIRVNHANFDVTGEISWDRKVTSSNGWATASIEKGKNGPLVGPYKVLGFISPALVSTKK